MSPTPPLNTPLSTTHALINFNHLCCLASDNCNNFVHTLFADFTKAFDYVDHKILFKKFISHNFPVHISSWILSFLNRRKQYVVINNKQSGLKTINAGAPQGTLCGPNVFKMLINDLNFDCDYSKYVDDSNVTTVSEDPNDDALQSASNHLFNWCIENGMKPNPRKCKDMVIYFGRKFTKESVPVLMVGGESIERVNSFKLLGVIFNSRLTWDNHVSYILSKVAKRFYIIFQLARIGVPPCDIILIYVSLIRSILEYACAVWHTGLTKAQSDDLERVQRRCLKIIYPDLTYRQALNLANIERLSERRHKIVRDMFGEIKQPGHVLSHLLTPRASHGHDVRDPYPYVLPPAKTKRFTTSFVPYCIRHKF